MKSFQDRYGEKEGLKKYNERIAKFSKTYQDKDTKTKEKENKSRGRTFKQLIDQFGQDKANEILNNRISNSDVFISNLENDIFNELDKNFHIKQQYKILYEGKNYYFDGQVDNIIIEVQGSYWHADKRLYNENDVIYNGKTAKEIWQYDEYKKYIAEQNNFKILYIYEYDYKKNKKQAISKLINEIYQFRNN